MVLGRDPESSEEPAPERVLARLESRTDHLVRIAVARAGLTGILEATGQHPFWTKRRGWQYSADLQRGDTLVDGAGNDITVTNIEVVAKLTRTFNLSIEGTHTYFVVADGLSVL